MVKDTAMYQNNLAYNLALCVHMDNSGHFSLLIDRPQIVLEKLLVQMATRRLKKHRSRNITAIHSKIQCIFLETIPVFIQNGHSLQ